IEYKVIENTAGDIFETYDQTQEGNENKLVISFAGRYSEQKNWPLAVEISEMLNEVLGDDLKVIMVVGCLDEKSEIKANKMLSKLTEKLGSKLHSQININIEEMDKIYYETDV